ncbi:MAG: peptidase M64 [Bacteroidetes bacterium]|nr:MAG: peptidase M64 [Bacteroidota bacterium]
MKKIILLALLLSSIATYAQFNKWFENKTLRLDYYHNGNHKNEIYSFDELLEEPYWGGSKTNLIDTFGYGNYFYKVSDAVSHQLLYSHGYSTLFYEWQTTQEADTVWRTFSETVIFPFPKKPVEVEIFKRNRKGKWKLMFSYRVDPKNYFIKKDRRLEYPYFNVHVTGDPANRVDVVILPEGYTKDQMGLFIADCEKFKNDFFKFEPYSSNKNKFNIRAVLAPSTNSGTDIPKDNIWNSTILNTGYYTFNSERYLMTMDDKSVRDLAANAPYDQIYILVNSTKYGGGAIYNYYNVSVNSNAKSAQILIHEFGHGFAALGDEYGYDNTYGDMYNFKIEPWEPNLTTLRHFDKKWKNMVNDTVPIPTPDIKKYAHVVGAFEGAGYVAKGIYRPVHDCMMRSFNTKEFCPVCRDAIQKMIDFYSK